MSNFFGTTGNDVANSALGVIIGFSGSILEELVDGIPDTFLCGAGDDFVFAGSAGDLIEGGDGFDRLNGAEGNDIIYAHLQSNITGSLTGDEILGNLGNDQIFGSAGGDHLEGGPGDDQLMGETGNDVLLGGDGLDTLVGGAGRDELHAGGNGGDTLTFFSGDAVAGEIIDGGIIRTQANDFTGTTITNCSRIEMFSGGVAAFTAAQILANLQNFSSIDPGLDGTVRIDMGATAVAQFAFTGDDQVYVIGDASNEVITTVSSAKLLGNGGDDQLKGIGGVLSGGTGNDVLEGSTGGDDTIIGGDGSDTMSWITALDFLPIVFTLAAGGDGDTFDFPWLGFDVFSGIENIVSGNASDYLAGNSVANALTGSGGNDRLRGAGGADTLNGGAGLDTIDWPDAAGAIVFTLSATGGGVGPSIAGIGQDSYSGMENVAGGSFADSLTGNAAANVLSGGGGADTLTDGGGTDTLNGEAGGDRFSLSADNASDTVNGGADSDAIDLYNSAGGVTVTFETAVPGKGTLAGGGLGAGAFLGIETIYGSLFNDGVNGGGGAEYFGLRAGNDAAHGGGGNDSLFGGMGQDNLDGGAGADRYIYTLAAESVDPARDILTHWDAADIIDLARVDANDLLAGDQFFTVSAAAPATGQMRIVPVTANGTVVLQMNTDADAAFEMVIQINTTLTVTAGDFVL